MKLRSTVAAFFGIAAVGVIAAATAYACTNLATLNLSKATGNPGDVVTVTGSSFAVPRAPGQAMVPVTVRWNGVDGPELAQATPDSAGNITATFSVPEGSPGYYVITAVQRNEKGVDQYGTPARASFQILAPSGATAAPATSQTPASPGAETSSSGMLALTIGLGVLGLALFGAGFTAFVRHARTRPVPAAARVRQDD